MLRLWTPQCVSVAWMCPDCKIMLPDWQTDRHIEFLWHFKRWVGMNHVAAAIPLPHNLSGTQKKMAGKFPVIIWGSLSSSWHTWSSRSHSSHHNAGRWPGACSRSHWGENSIPMPLWTAWTLPIHTPPRLLEQRSKWSVRTAPQRGMLRWWCVVVPYRTPLIPADVDPWLIAIALS